MKRAGFPRVQFEHRAAQPGIAAGKPVHERERSDPVDGAAGLELQARPGKLVLDGRNGKDAVALLFEIAVDAFGDGVFAGEDTDAVEIGIEQDEARVCGPELMERIGGVGGLRQRRQAG